MRHVSRAWFVAIGTSGRIPNMLRALPSLSILLIALSIGCGPATTGSVPVVDVPGMSQPPTTIEAAPSAEATPAPPKKPSVLTWETSETAARARAKTRKMPLVVFLYAEWAAPAVRMDRTTWSDPRVLERVQSFVPLRLDVTNADANAQAEADRFDLSMMPSIVILDFGGRELARIDGFAGPDEVLAAMAGVDTTSD